MKIPAKSRQCASLPLMLSAALLAGCAVGPNYKRPQVNSPAIFRDDTAPSNRSFGDLNWRQVYQDNTLEALIREAFTNNYDMRIATARVGGGAEWPQVEFGKRCGHGLLATIGVGPGNGNRHAHHQLICREFENLHTASQWRHGHGLEGPVNKA